MNRYSRPVWACLAVAFAAIVTPYVFAQSGPDWNAMRQRAVTLSQEVDAAQRRLDDPAIRPADLVALLESERFSIAYMALRAASTSPKPDVRALALRHVLSRSEGLIVQIGETAAYLRMIKFDEFTGEFEYREGNMASQMGRVEGVSMSLPGVKTENGQCRAKIEFDVDLKGAGVATCDFLQQGIPVSVSFR